MPSQLDTPTTRALADRNTVRVGIGAPSVLTAVALVNPRSNADLRRDVVRDRRAGGECRDGRL